MRRAPQPRRRRLRPLYCSLFALAVACVGAPSGPPFQLAEPPPDNRARLYVYRLDPHASYSTVRVSVAGRDLGQFRNGEYETVELPAGTRLLRAGVRSLAFVNWGWNEQRVRLEPGETAFVRLSVKLSESGPPEGSEADIAGRPSGRATQNVYIELRSEDQALEDLAGTTRLPAGS